MLFQQQEFTSAKSKWESDRSVFTVKFEQQSSELQARLNAISRRETVNEQVQQVLCFALAWPGAALVRMLLRCRRIWKGFVHLKKPHY